MQIKKLKIRGLYGHIDKDIEFYEDITLLVGINGSGKTSTLNILNWVLKPSLPNLCVTEFNSISINLVFNNKTYDILCELKKTLFKLYIRSGNESFHPLTITLNKHPSEITNDEQLKNQVLQSYFGLGPDEKEKKTWELLNSFPKPTVIGLDRNLFAEEKNYIYIDEDFTKKVSSRGSLAKYTPLDRVKEIVNTEYRKRKNSILNLTDDMKNHLMLSTFDGSITQQSFTKGIRYKLDLNKIEDAEHRVNDYFNKVEKKVLNATEKLTISKYFSQLKDITKKYQLRPNEGIVKLLYGLNANQFVKVNKLLEQFERFESESKKALEKITNYLETLNSFFKDSSKQILFKEDTSELCFSTLDKNGNILTQYNDIKYLSSGEQQILILFSYIAFNGQDGKIFIIDEPELSLHIKWQEEFLEKLESITPHSTQLILATHSPILANRKKSKAKILLPYNN